MAALSVALCLCVRDDFLETSCFFVWYLSEPHDLNHEIATILGNSESTVKKHVLEIFDKLGVETRTAAGLRALEVLSSSAAHG